MARAMVHDPEILVLDEPTSGVDPSGQLEVRQIMLDVAHKENKTVFLSSHNLDEVQRICNRIALIDRGGDARYFANWAKDEALAAIKTIARARSGGSEGGE